MDITRIIITSDVRSPDGLLRVQAGAIGTVRSCFGDQVGVLFDPGQDPYIEPDGGGRLFRHVPALDTIPLDLHHYIQSKTQH